MNIIAIMGPHGVYYKDEPIKELERALQSTGFQIIWPQNSVDLLKFIEHNPRICGVIFDWDEYSLDLCSEINQLNEYLPLYAFINTNSTLDVSVHDMRMALWFWYTWGWLKISRRAFINIQTNISIILRRRLPKRFYLRQRRKIYLLYAGSYGGNGVSEKPAKAACFMTFWRQYLKS